MKLHNVFKRKKSSSSLRKDESSSSGSLSSGSVSPQSKLFSSKSLTQSPQLRSRLTSCKSAPLPTSLPTVAYADSPLSSACESGASSDKSSEYSSEYQELVEVFRLFDSNGDGKISSSELGSVLNFLGDNPTEEDLKLMVNEADSDGDGFIDLSEFIKLHKVASGDDAKSEELKAAFCVFDADKNGLISAQELHNVLTNLGDKGLTLEDCCQMIKGVDRDGDGSVNFDEFERMMKNNF